MVNRVNHTTLVQAAEVIVKMKNRQDPRHKRREKAIKSLFALSFHLKIKLKTPGNSGLAGKVTIKQPEIDKIISKAAPEWPIQQINHIDLAILRLAIYELVIEPRQPPKVVIDEAVELAKTYGSENSPSFVNGVLGTILRDFDK